MVASRFGRLAAVAIVIGGLVAGLSSPPAAAQILIVGNDEKQGWDENSKPIFREPGKDTLTVIDISKPDTPQIASSIPLMNSVVGPPTNLAISPSGDIALVANSVEPVVQGWGHRLEPDNKVFLIDLKAHPPAVLGTITVGKQPSGMAISPKGDLALVANRADGTISVLSIRGKDVLVLDTVTVGAPADQVSAVAITPDGKHALAAKSAAVHLCGFRQRRQSADPWGGYGPVRRRQPAARQHGAVPRDQLHHLAVRGLPVADLTAGSSARARECNRNE